MLLHGFVKLSHDLTQDCSFRVIQRIGRLEVVSAILAPNKGNIMLRLFDTSGDLSLLNSSVSDLSTCS
jgi:hypothetical protein